jgi:hypothetical protein
MPTKKEQLNVRVSKRGLGLLYQLQEYYQRQLGIPGFSQADLIEKLLNDAANTVGITYNPLASPMRRSK